MKLIQKFRKSPQALFIAGCSFVFISSFWSSFPVFIFFAFAPILALLDFTWNPKKIYYLLPVLLIAFLCLNFIPGSAASLILYGFATLTLFTVFAAMQYFTENRFNKFSLIILWIGVEYLLLEFMVLDNTFFLADILAQKTNWIRWNIYTGYLGISFWIMFANLLFYQSFFKYEAINVVFFVLAILVIGLPIVYSFNLTNNAITKDEVISLYSGSHNDLGTPYARNGELISRTGAWVSLLIVIFTLVRALTKKVAR